MWTRRVLLVLILNVCEGVIYKLSDDDYNRMPPVFKLDDIHECFQNKGGPYCQAKFDLVSDQPSELLDMIKEYSAHYTKHFNYTNLKYGICLSKCGNYDPNKERGVSLESCLNSTLWESHELKAKVLEFTCRSSERRWDITTADIYVAVFFFVLITLNIVGSIHHYVGAEHLVFLQYFSMQRNWRQLIKTTEEGQEPRLTRLKAFHGIRSINALLVIMAHALVPVMLFIDNTRYVESFYDDLEKHILLNGTVTVQTFFIMSGFLQVYNFQLFVEKNRVTWKLIPRTVVMRWLRFLPPYGVMLALTSTWVRFIGYGPLWHMLITEEHEDCKKFWWRNLLYINNYDDVTKCYPHTWSLACDMQLTILGVIVLVLSTRNTSAKRYKITACLLISAVLIILVNTYYYDLDGALIVSPTLIGNMFMNDKNYNLMYKRGHTNLFNYALGMWMGYSIYDIQKKNIDVQKYKKYKPLYWSLVPLLLLLLMSGAILYRDGPKLHVAARILYEIMFKTLFGGMIMILMAGMILQYEDLYRGILEWPGWVPLGRVSYCSFLVHTTILRVYFGQSKKLNHVTYMFLIKNVIAMIIASFVLASILWLLVEAPMNQIIKKLLRSKDARSKRKFNIGGDDARVTAENCITSKKRS